MEKWSTERKGKDVHFRPEFISDQTGIDRLSIYSSSTTSLHKYLFSQSNMAATQCIWTCRHGRGGLLQFKAYLMFWGFFLGHHSGIWFLCRCHVTLISISYMGPCDKGKANTSSPRRKLIVCVCMKMLKSEFFSTDDRVEDEMLRGMGVCIYVTMTV